MRRPPEVQTDVALRARGLFLVSEAPHGAHLAEKRVPDAAMGI